MHTPRFARHCATTAMTLVPLLTAFALDETYARALVVEDGTNWSEDGGTAPPGPTVHCECGFQEYGSQHTTNNC